MKILTLCLLLAISVTTTRAEIALQKRDEIEKMLQLTGMAKLMDQMKEQMVGSFRQSMPKVPVQFWTKFAAKMDMNQLLEKLIPVYDKYYTVEDLKAVNVFYASAAGQKLLATMPQAMQESMQIGQQWGREVGELAAKEASAEIEAESAGQPSSG